MTMTTMIGAVGPHAMAGFWRRLGAFFIDGLLLGIIGQALGFSLTPEFVHLGPWGRLLGFAVAITYFGLLNSRLTNGQTIGKRLVKIKVVGGDGTPLSVARSFIRFLPLGAAWFLNGVMFPISAFTSALGYISSIAVFGLGLSIAYLFLFNRQTRQSLHDLLVNSYVLKARSTVAALNTPVWKVHLIVCAVLIAASGIAPYFLMGLAAQAPFAGLFKIYGAVVAEPGVVHAMVNKGRTAIASSNNGPSQTSHLNITAYLDTPDIQNAGLAKRLAIDAIKADSSVDTVDLVQVKLVYGYDIGIASLWRSQNYSRSPAGWSTP